MRGLFEVSSHRPKEQRDAPQATEPSKNIYYEIPSGLIEKLLANPYAGDGTLYPHMHLIYVDYLSLQAFPRMKSRRKSYLYL